jgi:hypothetical protein
MRDSFTRHSVLRNVWSSNFECSQSSTDYNQMFSELVTALLTISLRPYVLSVWIQSVLRKLITFICEVKFN